MELLWLVPSAEMVTKCPPPQAVEDEEAILRMIRSGKKDPKRKLSVSWKATWDEKKSEEAEGRPREQHGVRRKKSINFELFDVSRKVSISSFSLSGKIFNDIICT